MIINSAKEVHFGQTCRAIGSIYDKIGPFFIMQNFCF